MRVLLIGGSGLVGRVLVARLAARADVQLDLLLRTAPPEASANLASFVGNPLTSSLQAWQESGRACDVFISALGTTRRIAGSVEGFARIDRDLVLQVAQAARERGARHALIVSSIGADPRSGNAYLRVKGELEEGITALGFDRCDFLQPGLLLGARAGQTSRPAERFGQWLAPVLNPLLVGSLARYRAIEAGTVAAAAAALLGHARAGLHRHDFRALSTLTEPHGAGG